MLTKNATFGLMLRAVTDYIRGFAGMFARAVRDGIRHRRRPPVRDLLLRAQVIRSFIRQAPTALRERRALRRRALISARDLQTWLVSRR
jgi:hypothetical protein